MKRYLVFSSAVDYPLGGWDDFIADYASLSEAIDAATDRANLPSRVGWGQVVDTETLTVVSRKTS